MWRVVQDHSTQPSLSSPCAHYEKKHCQSLGLSAAAGIKMIPSLRLAPSPSAPQQLGCTYTTCNDAVPRKLSSCPFCYVLAHETTLPRFANVWLQALVHATHIVSPSTSSQPTFHNSKPRALSRSAALESPPLILHLSERDVFIASDAAGAGRQGTGRVVNDGLVMISGWQSVPPYPLLILEQQELACRMD